MGFTHLVWCSLMGTRAGKLYLCCCYPVLRLSCFHSHSYVLSALLTMLLQTRLTRSIMYIVISVCRCFTLYALFRFPTRNCKPERRERERSVTLSPCSHRGLSSPNSTTIPQLRPSRRPHSLVHWSAPLIPSTCLHFIINKHPVIFFPLFCHVFNPPHLRSCVALHGPGLGARFLLILLWFTTNWIHWIYFKKGCLLFKFKSIFCTLHNFHCCKSGFSSR